MECTNDVCGMRCVGGLRRKGSEWWNVEVGGAAAKMRRAFEEWLQRRDCVTNDRFQAQRVFVKWAVKVQKEWRTGNWENDCGMILSLTKRYFGKS